MSIFYSFIIFFQIIFYFINSYSFLSFTVSVSYSYFMAKDMPSLKLKMRYEVIPLIKEYIKDGILRSMSDDDKYFDCWKNAECYYPSTSDYTTE